MDRSSGFPRKILITGADSYIGTSFRNWVAQFPMVYKVDTLDVEDHKWREVSFSGYDVVLHVAAIVHVAEKDLSLYRKVNRDLAIAIAKKAKEDGVLQFIFLSTMGVYGMDVGHITSKTAPNPRTPYAISKLEAEGQLQSMSDRDFGVAILRPPLVYGKGCKGNYPRLAKMARILPVFPEVSNQRSMLHIDNLSEFIRSLINTPGDGLFFPQNEQYVNTSELVRLIASAHGKEIYFTKALNWCMPAGLGLSGSFRKVFGSLTYDRALGSLCNTVSFEESVLQTERP